MLTLPKAQWFRSLSRPSLKITQIGREGGDPPLVSIIMIVSREKTNPDWVAIARASLLRQSFDRYEIIEIDNNELLFSIGKCWNCGVDAATSDIVVFVSDDDWISLDYISSTYSCIIDALNDSPVSSIHTYTTAVCVESEDSRAVQKISTGMWTREFLLENRFDESLKNQVDTTFFKKRDDDGNTVGIIMPWHFGYFYRQHDGMVSGRIFR